MRKVLFAAGLALLIPGWGVAAPLLTISDDSGQIGDVDLRTGAVTNLRRLDRNFTDLAYDPQGRLYGLDFSELSVIEGATTREIGAHGMGGSANGLAFGRDGTLYGSSTGSTRSISGPAGPPGRTARLHLVGRPRLRGP